MNYDAHFLTALRGYVERALDQQEPHVADQLRAAFHDGKTEIRFENRDGFPHVVVAIDGYDVTAVDIRNLIPLDDLM